MLRIGNVPEQMGACIERGQAALQLRSCCEHNVHSTTKILLCPFERLRRHARLGLNAVNAVINRGVETSELEINARVRVKRPQQWHTQIKT